MEMTDRSTDSATRIDRGSALKYVLAIIFVVYLFSAKGFIQSVDTDFSVRTAEAILTRGALDIPYQETFTLIGPDGRSYSKYGIGLPIYFIPWVAASHAIHRATGIPTEELTGFLISFANIPFALLTLYLFARFLRILKTNEFNTLLLVIALGLGTLCWRYALNDKSEPMEAALLLLALNGVMHCHRKGILIGGMGFAGLILVKLVHIVLLPVFLGYLMVRPNRPHLRRIGEAAAFTLPIVMALLFVAVLNLVRFGSMLESGYGREAGQFFPSQLWWTIPNLFFSLDKGLFIFCPVLVLGLFGWLPFLRQYPYEAALCAAVVLINLLLVGAWWAAIPWMGGWAWGPRLLVPAIPFWLLPVAFWLEGRSQVRFYVTILLTLASIVNQVPGVLVRDQAIHHVKHNLLTPEEQAVVASDYSAGWHLLWHKLTVPDGREVYRVSEFGVPGDREIDLTSFQTFKGFNLWTEQAARHLNRPMIRWLPLFGVLMIGYCVMKLWIGARSRAR